MIILSKRIYTKRNGKILIFSKLDLDKAKNKNDKVSYLIIQTG
jgi:hypothetical protein